MWFITAHGPFQHHRARFNPNNASLYRFCVRGLETAGYLLSDCTKLGEAEFSDTKSFELICISIVQRLLNCNPPLPSCRQKDECLVGASSQINFNSNFNLD